MVEHFFSPPSVLLRQAVINFLGKLFIQSKRKETLNRGFGQNTTTVLKDCRISVAPTKELWYVV